MNERHDDERQHAREVSRLDSFSDGVFAIAITLLALTIQAPSAETTRAGGLAVALARNWPTYIAYIISFTFVLIMWANHHTMFRYIVRSDRWLLLLNGVLLMLVTLVPFPTELLASFATKDAPDARTAALVYNGLFTAVAVAFNLLWWYVSHHAHLLDKDFSERFRRTITRRYRLGPVLYLTAFALAFVSVPASLALNIALALFYAVPGRFTLAGREA